MSIPLKCTAFASWFSKCLWMTLALLVVNLGQSGHPNTSGDTVVQFSLSPFSLIEGCIWKEEYINTHGHADK